MPDDELVGEGLPTEKSALLSAWFPLMPVAWLASPHAPITIESPSIAAELPNRSPASVFDAFKYACCDHDVPVPKGMGPMLWLNQALPFWARVALAHLTKADDILRHIDAGERAAYVERVKANA